VALVVGAAGPGLAPAYAEVGAVLVDPVRRATSSDFLRAIETASSRQVVVLPNDERGIEPARVAADLAAQQGRQVVVIPTRTQLHGLAAAAVHDPHRSLADDVARMSTAAGAVREGTVSVGGVGYLGRVQGDPAVAGGDLLTVVSEVVDKMLAGGGELLTLVTGDHVDAEVLASLSALVGAEHPDVEVVALAGGQLRETVLVGVE
jgi:dihydroxyacetone kinase-like predicted kinase